MKQEEQDDFQMILNDIFAYGVNLIFLYLTLTQTSYIIFVFYYPDHSY